MLVSAQSRLKSDFEVIGTIGRGGFGHVFKVKFFTKKETKQTKRDQFRYKIN
jgi:hypothetical protein